jgi:hypothetical protein
MFAKVIVFTVVLAIASAANELSCKERLSSPVPTTPTITWHSKADCPDGVDISVPFLSSAAGNAIIIKNIQLMNGSNVVLNTDSDLFSIVVEQPMMSTDPNGPLETLMICSSLNMAFCMDRASKDRHSHITIKSNATSDLSVYFTVQEMPTDDLAGYQNCLCEGATSVTAHGEATPVSVKLPGNLSAGVEWSSTAKPCLGSLCSYLISTDEDSSIDIKFLDTFTLTNQSYVQCKVLGTQIDVFNNDTQVATPSFNISDYNLHIVKNIFSNKLFFYVFVDYLSYDNFKNSSLLPQSKFTMNVSTPLVPTDVIVNTPIKFTASTATKQTISAPSMMMAYPTQTVEWSVSNTVKDKDNKKYQIGYSKIDCTGIMKGSNYMVVRETDCNGKILTTIESCSDLTTSAVGTGENNLCVSWIRENSTLDTGNWELSFNLIETSAAVSVSSVGSLLFVALIALFVKQ